MWAFQNNFDFSLYAMLFVCYIVVTSENKIKSKKVSSDEGMLL